MRHGMISFLLIAMLLMFAGCGHRESIGCGFELRQASSGLNMDGHPGVFLYYQGKEVWHQISWGYPYSPKDFFHGDIFVFESPVPEADSYNNCGISPQLYAIRGSGPPVLISQRIMGVPLKGGNSVYAVQNTGVSGTGVRVEFEYPAADGGDETKTNVVSWAEIASWVDEAEKSSPPVKTPLGSYRLLTVKRQ
jgi:hypothetical protein